MPYLNRNESHRHRRHTYGWPTLPGVRSASTGNLSSTVRARELDIHVDIDVSHIAGGEPHCRRFRYQAALRRASGQNPWLDTLRWALAAVDGARRRQSCRSAPVTSSQIGREPCAPATPVVAELWVVRSRVCRHGHQSRR